ncbi:hypothetical protein TrRE_jg1091, partial [Triparma retinervis]
LGNLIKIGSFLAEVESAARASSTTSWLSNAGDCDLVLGLRFLLKKAEVCHVDLVNSKLLQIIPFVKASGADYERAKFVETYGEGGKSALGVVEWVDRLKQGRDEGVTIEDVFKGTGCVDEVLFSTASGGLKFPEVFNMDIGLFMEAREAAKVSGAVCAIAAHLRSTLGGGRGIDEEDARPLVELLRSSRIAEKDLMATCWRMGEDAAGRKMSAEEREALKGRIQGCLDKTDSVAKLFERRIVDWFRKLFLKKKGGKGVVPEGMRSGLVGEGRGRGSGSGSGRGRGGGGLGREEANKLGLGVVAGGLVEVGAGLKEAVDHMWSVHGGLLEKMIE